MTRINYGIHPSELSDKHLIAEHREIKRIPNVIASGKARIGNKHNNYSMGKGHVCFFYDKIFYLFKRYQQIYNECCNRGFNVTNYQEAFNSHRIPILLYGDSEPTIEDRADTLSRLMEKAPEFYKTVLANDALMLF